MRAFSGEWVCGFCGEPAALFRRGALQHEPVIVVLAWHVIEAHGLNMGDLDQARRVGQTSVLPDGRVWGFLHDPQ
jgi:hypothetical protein